MPGLASFSLAVATISSLFYTLFVHRLPLFSLQQQYRNGRDRRTKTSSAHLRQVPVPDEAEKELGASCWDRPPPVWPMSLVIVQRRIPDPDSKVGPARTVTYYDSNAGGNLIQITPIATTNDAEQPKTETLWDLELNTGHSYYFTPSQQTCKAIDMPVGILRPNWLEGATPLGPSMVDNSYSWNDGDGGDGDNDGDGASPEERVVCGYTKADFIDYYVDAKTGLPDSWYFHTMKATFQVLNYMANPAIDPALFIPPKYCHPEAN